MCENNKIYVGETKHLYNRLNQHMSKRGSKHTIENNPQSLCALYKVHGHYRFYQLCDEMEKDVPDEEYVGELLQSFSMIEWNNKDWARFVEDFLTEYLLQFNDIDTYGGKYTGVNKDHIERRFAPKVFHRVPLCKCKFPAEVRLKKVKIKEKTYYKLYFVCCIENAWTEMRKDMSRLGIQEGCSFYQEYMEHIEQRIL